MTAGNDTNWLNDADGAPPSELGSRHPAPEEAAAEQPNVVPRYEWEQRDRTYLGSHRALGACSRELARLADGVVRGAKALALVDDSAIEVRVLPDHCIAQLGDVAVTFKWIRHAMHTIADGELMVIGWNGRVGARAQGAPERVTGPAAAARATVAWEESFTAHATTEADWLWRRGEGGETLTSSVLATHIVERLRTSQGLRGDAEATG